MKIFQQGKRAFKLGSRPKHLVSACYSPTNMSALDRLNYYRRIFRAYFLPGASQLTFWHETPQVNSHMTIASLGEYYMPFSEKAEYAGSHDKQGIPMLNYHGKIGLQYNPIAIAQWGLGNFNLFKQTQEPIYKTKFVAAGDWLCDHLEQNSSGIWVWQHYFDWEYRTKLKAPWHSGWLRGKGFLCWSGRMPKLERFAIVKQPIVRSEVF